MSGAARRAASEREPRGPSARALLVLALVALVLRVAHVLAVRETLFARVPLGDAALFLEGARAVRAEGWLAGDAFQAPLYAWFLAGVQALCGEDPLAVRLAQAVLGAAGCVLVASGGASFLGRRAGLVGGWLVALHAPLVWSGALVQKPALAFFLGAGALAALASWARSPRIALALVAGAVLGLLAWTRQSAAVLLPVAVTWCVLGPVALRSRARFAHAGVVFAGFLAASAPFLVRTALVTGELLPGTANLGVNLWIGNHAGADGLYQPVVAGRSHPDFEARDARRLAERAEGRPLSEGEVSAHWAREAREWALAHPGAWARLAAKKLAFAGARVEVMDAEAYEVHVEASPPLAALAGYFDFGLVGPLALLGIVATRRRWRASWLLHAALAALLATLVVFFVTARFRMALVPWAAPLAGAGLVALVDLALARAWRRLALAAGSLLVLGALARLPIEQGGDPRAATRANLAAALVERGELAPAEREARAALAREPKNVAARFALARVLLARGDLVRAREELREVALLEPALQARALSLFAAALGERGDDEEAARLLEEAVALDPSDALARHRLALALRRSGRIEEAEQAWREALALDPQLATAHNDLGLLLERRGAIEEALVHYEAAHEADPRMIEPLAHLARIRASDPDPARRDGLRATELARRALAIDGTDAPDLLDLLAAAEAETGDLDAATLTAERALDLARARGEHELARAIEGRLASYRAGRPWRFER